MVGWEVGLVISVTQSPLPKPETDWLSIWPAGRTSEDTCSDSRVLVIRVLLWTGRETSVHRNISYLERKDSCEIYKKNENGNVHTTEPICKAVSRCDLSTF